MRCPFCGVTKDRVVDSRMSKDGAMIRRRRECSACLKRFTTYEEIEDVTYVVVKKDKRREPFDRQKLLAGLVRACEKRPIGTVQLEEIVNEVERQLHSKPEKEISTHEIGEYVMDELRALDQVAYVRFASVYRDFKSADQFLKELEQLLHAEH
ncbi:MAG TPA: transcriptional regulator NrdR [bacterium]|nr:transcriptional regulator NrdR [bacterium]